MTRDELAAEVDCILADGGRVDALRRLILRAADSYAAGLVEAHARTPLADVEHAWAAARSQRRLSNAEKARLTS